MPVIQALSQMDSGDVEFCEDSPVEDDTEDDTEELRELKNDWRVNPFQLISTANADAKCNQMCYLQKSYFDSQHIEIPKQPPRSIL